MKRFSVLTFVLFLIGVEYVNAQCASSGTSGSTYIDQIYFPEPGDGTANLNASGDNSYEDFSSLGSRREFVYFNQSAENKFGIGINLPSAGIDYFYKVWIDFDQDDVFESGELIWQGFGTSTGAETIIDEASFNIIGSSISGETTIRFIVKEGSAVSDACETGFTGEVEDYTITLPPPSVSVDNVSKDKLNPGTDIDVDYSVVLGNLNGGNTLTVQLSDATGDFSSPIDIGTLATSTNLGTITATIPLATPEGTGYRVRVNSSDPPSIGDIGATNIEVTNDDISTTELSPGDIVVVCLNGDGTDGFGFITLVDIKEGTEIYFKDAGWESDNQWWNNNSTSREGMVTFTAPAGATAGSYYRYDKNTNSAPWSSTDHITNLGTGTNGDQIIAYQGTLLAPVMVYAVNKSVFPGDGWDASATSDRSSAVPLGLVDGVTAVGLKRFDNYAYTGATISGSASELLAAVSDKANWTGHASQIPACPAAGFTVIQDVTPLEAEMTVNTSTLCNGGASGELTVSVTSGVAPFDYSWSNGASTIASTDAFNTVTGLVAGTYTVTITDDDGATIDVDATVSEPTAISVSIVSSSDVSCAGLSDGEATASATGGTGALVYTWTGGLTGASVTGLSAGVKTVSVTDDNSCGPITEDVTINGPAVISVSIASSSDVSCAGLSDGEATASATGGTGTLVYSWTGGLTGASVTGLSAGVKTVSVTDDNSCGPITEDVTINEPSGISVSIVSSSDVSCAGLSDGEATASATGGTGTLVYTWTGGLTGASVTGLSAGVKTVSVVDDNACPPVTADVTINEPSGISVSIVSSSNVSCSGQSDGEATASATGGTGTLVYSWTGGLSGASVTGLSAGVKTVSVVDDNACPPVTADVTITDPDPIFVSITGLSAITCNGLSNGTATASALGGTGTLDYTWTGGFSGASVTGLSAGPKTVSVTDDNSCGPFTANVIIHEPSAISASITSSSDVSCNGLSDGSASASGSGGTGSLVYTWTGGATGSTVNTLAPGLNTVSVTDANGCSPATDDVTINEPDVISVSITGSTDITCNGASTGTASASAIGGTGTLDYTWTGGATGASVTGLSAGVNTVSVTDDNGCGPFTADVIVNEPSPISVSVVSSTDISCNGLSDGEASAIATGGTGTLVYSWTGGLTGSSVSGLSAGSKTVSVTDDNLCGPITADVTIEEPGVIDVSISSSSDVSCNGLDDGSATAAGSGGTGTLVYTWTGGASGASVTGLSAGVKTVSVTDANGCAPATDDVTINEPTALSVSIAGSTDVSCNSISDGTAMASALGGSGTLVYSWTGGLSGASVTGLSAGVKTVSVTDANLCGPVTADVTIIEPSAIDVSISTATDITCNGLTNGTAEAIATGGTGTLVYSWTGGLSGSSVSGLSSGVKTVSVTDDNSCPPATVDVTIVEPEVLTISMISGTDPGCTNDDGTATVGVEGGTGTYTYTWSNGGSTATINGLVGGTYSVSVDDANSCGPVTSSSIELIEPSTVSANAGPDQLLIDQFATTLAGTDDVNGSGEWLQITGTVATIDDDTNPVTEVSSLSLGVSEFVWTVTGACNVARDTVELDVTTVTDLAKSELTSIHVYPNPAADFVTIEGLNGDLNSIELVDLTGQTIMRTTETRLNISNLPEGVYLIQVNGSEGTMTKRIVKRN